jgi:hypothetical protein
VLRRQLDDRPVVLDDVHVAPVGDLRHGQPRDTDERLAVVERAREDVAGVDDERALLLDPLAVVDVRRRSHPQLDLAVVVADRDRPAEMPAVCPVRGAESVLDLEHVAGRERLAAPRERSG